VQITGAMGRNLVECPHPGHSILIVPDGQEHSWALCQCRKNQPIPDLR